MKLYHIYRGRTLWRNMEPNAAMRWHALGVGRADTLAGMKQLVRDHKD